MIIAVRLRCKNCTNVDKEVGRKFARTMQTLQRPMPRILYEQSPQNTAVIKRTE